MPFQAAAEALDGLQLGGCLGQLGLGSGEIHFRRAVTQGLLGLLLGPQCRFLVDIVGAQGRIGQHGDHARLHLKHAAGDVERLFLVVTDFQAHLAGAKTRQQWRVPGGNADFTHDGRGKDHLGLAGENLQLGADDIDVYGHGHGWLPGDQRFLAFSTACSMVPTM